MNEYFKTQPESSLNHLKDLHNDTVDAVGGETFRNLIVNPRFNIEFDGSYAGWVELPGSMTQYLPDCLEPNTTYTLIADVEFMNDVPTDDTISITVDGRVLVIPDNNSRAKGALIFTTNTVIGDYSVVLNKNIRNGRHTIHQLTLVKGELEIGPEPKEVELSHLLSRMIRHDGSTWTISHDGVSFSKLMSQDSVEGTNGIVVSTVGEKVRISQQNVVITGDASGTSVAGATDTTINLVISTIAGSLNIGQNLRVQGDLQVDGTVYSMNTLEVDNPLLIINKDGTDLTGIPAGISVNRGGTLTNALLIWDEASTTWKVSDDVGNLHTILTDFDIWNELADMFGAGVAGAHQGLTVTYDSTTKNIAFRVNTFTVNLQGDVNGTSGLVQLENDGQTITIVTTMSPVANVDKVDGRDVDPTGTVETTNVLWPADVIKAKIEAALATVLNPISNYSRMYEEKVVTGISVPTAGLTFTLTNPNVYTVGTNTLEVYRNGQRLPNADYIEVNTTQIQILVPLNPGETLIFTEGRTNGSALWDSIIGKPTFAMDVPTGTVVPYAGSVAPGGWSECDGGELDRTLDANLFGVIGTTFGIGNGTTTYNKPDLRGEFIRGWDHGRGVDLSRLQNSWQTDMIKAHSHTFHRTMHRASIHDVITYDVGGGEGVINDGITDVFGGVETRPRNIAMMYIIKL